MLENPNGEIVITRADYDAFMAKMEALQIEVQDVKVNAALARDKALGALLKLQGENEELRFRIDSLNDELGRVEAILAGRGN